MRRVTIWGLLVSLSLLVVPAVAQQGEGSAEPEEGFGGVGVELMADPVFAAMLTAFQTQHDVGCSIAEGGHEETSAEGGTLHALWLCMSNVEGNSDNWAIQVTGWWTPGGVGLSSVTFSALE